MLVSCLFKKIDVTQIVVLSAGVITFVAAVAKAADFVSWSSSLKIRNRQTIFIVFADYFLIWILCKKTQASIEGI